MKFLDALNKERDLLRATLVNQPPNSPVITIGILRELHDSYSRIIKDYEEMDHSKG